MNTTPIAERVANIKSETNASLYKVRTAIQMARNAQIVADKQLEEAIESISVSIDQECEKRIRDFVHNGIGSYCSISEELKVYYDVEAKLRCYREIK